MVGAMDFGGGKNPPNPPSPAAAAGFGTTSLLGKTPVFGTLRTVDCSARPERSCFLAVSTSGGFPFSGGDVDGGFWPVGGAGAVDQKF